MMLRKCIEEGGGGLASGWWEGAEGRREGGRAPGASYFLQDHKSQPLVPRRNIEGEEAVEGRALRWTRVGEEAFTLNGLRERNIRVQKQGGYGEG